MPKIERTITIKNEEGLHARPAALLVQIVSKYESKVTIQKGDEKINGKSIMGLLTLGAQKNSQLTIKADGKDAQEVISELEELLLKEEII